MQVFGIRLKRDGLHWMVMRGSVTDKALVIESNRIPPWPRMYTGKYEFTDEVMQQAVVDVQQMALSEITQEVFSLSRRLAKARHWYTPWRPKGINLSTLKVYHSIDDASRIHTIAWKALAR